MKIKILLSYVTLVLSIIANGQNKDKFILKLKDKTPFYYTQRHIEYNNIDYAPLGTDILIYNSDLKYFNAIRLNDFEPMIIEKKYLNLDESIIQEINSFGLNKEDAINIAKDFINLELQKKLEEKRLLDIAYKKIGLVFLNSSFTNKIVKSREQILKEVEILVNNVSSSNYTELKDEFDKVTNFKNLGLRIKNAYDKDIKYIRFNLVPYNRVDDVISRSLIETKKIEIIGPFKSDTEDYFIFNEVWLDENNIVDYIKITDIKITFMDNQVIAIKNSSNQFVTKTNRINLE